MESWRKLLCLFLAMVMCLSLMPLSAFAAEEEEEQNLEEELTDILNEDPAEEGQEYGTGDEPGDVTDEPTASGEGDPTGEPGNIPADELSEDPEEDAEEEQISVMSSGTCGSNATWTLDANGNLIISGTGEISGFHNNTEIKTVTIEEGITGIGSEAFYFCDQITSVTIPSSLISIGYGAFQSCTGLTSIALPQSGLMSIGGNAFWSCTHLAGFTFPNSVTSIAGTAFGFCKSLTSIAIPNSVAIIGERAFMQCSNLKEISFTGDAPSFGENCFTGVTATAYYPANDNTWTVEVMQNYGGTITWINQEGTEPITEGVAIDEMNFPDPIFREYVREHFDLNEDGVLSSMEAGNVTEINVSQDEDSTDDRIRSLQGVEMFIKLKTLKCAGNHLGILNLSENKSLEYLDCSSCVLNSLDIRGNQKLFTLDCHDNLLDELDLSGNPELCWLDCTDNYLKEIDLRNCPVLMKDIWFGVRELTPDYIDYRRDDGNSVVIALSYDRSAILLGDLIGEKNYNNYQHSNAKRSDAHPIPGFTGIEEGHRISREVLRKLIWKAGEGQAKSLIRTYYVTGDFKNWPGFCSGISATLVLTYLKMLDTGDISSSGWAENYSEMDYPFQDTKLLDSIIYYQASNMLDYGGRKARIATYSRNGKTDSDLSAFLRALVEAAQTHEALLLKYDYKHHLKEYGHSILILGCRKDEDENYLVRLYDENCIRANADHDACYEFMEISADFSDFTIKTFNGESLGKTELPYIAVVDPELLLDIRNGNTFRDNGGMIPVVSGEASIVFSEEDSFCLTAEDGRTLNCDGGDVSGTLEVLDCDFNPCETDNGASGVTWTLRIPAGSYTLTDIVQSIDFTYYDDDSFYSLCGEGIESAVFSREDGVTLNGENYRFDLAMGTESLNAAGEPGLAVIAADCNGSFTLSPLNGTLLVTADGELKNVSAGAYVDFERRDNAVEDGLLSFHLTADGEIMIADVVLEQDYLALRQGETYPGLRISTSPSGYENRIVWSAESLEGDTTTLVSIDPVTGAITAASDETGTAYVVAAIRQGQGEMGNIRAARCRVDVVEDTGTGTPIADDVGKTDEGGKTVNGITLLDSKATVELYQTDYTRVRIVPILSQNDIGTASVDDITGETPDLTGTGAAVTGAYFENDQAAALFDLRVVDDRTLEIVPKNYALTLGQSAPKSIKGNYTTKVMVVLEDRTDIPFDTGTLKLSVKKDLPKMKAAAVKLNSWLPDPKDEQELAFSGGTVTAIEADPSNSIDWLNVEKIRDGVFQYTGTEGAKKSGKLKLMLTVDGWRIKVPVTVSITAASTAPKLKFIPAALTLKPGTYDSASTTVSFTPAAYNDRVVTVGEIYEGKDDVTTDGVLDTVYYNGTLTVRPGAVPRDGKAHTYKVFLYVDGKKTGSVTVKILAAKVRVGMSIKAVGAIDTAIPKSVITLTPSWKNYHAGSGEGVVLTEIRKAVGKTSPETITEQFNVSTDGTSYMITAKDSFVWEKGYTYSALLTGTYGKSQTESTAVKLSIKASTKQPAISLALKSSGSIDVLRPETTSVVLTPTIKNWFDYELEDAQVSFSAKNGKTDVTDQIGDAFAWETENGGIVITAKPGAALNHSWKYSVTVTIAIGGKNYTKTAALKVVQGTAEIVQDVKAVELLKRDKYSNAVVKLAPNDPLLRIDRAELDTKSAAIYELVRLGDNSWEIHYLNFAPENPKSGTVKLSVFLTGNRTGKANAIASVKVNIR